MTFLNFQSGSKIRQSLKSDPLSGCNLRYHEWTEEKLITLDIFMNDNRRSESLLIGAIFKNVHNDTLKHIIQN